MYEGSVINFNTFASINHQKQMPLDVYIMF